MKRAELPENRRTLRKLQLEKKELRSLNCACKITDFVIETIAKPYANLLTRLKSISML